MLGEVIQADDREGSRGLPIELHLLTELMSVHGRLQRVDRGDLRLVVVGLIERIRLTIAGERFEIEILARLVTQFGGHAPDFHAALRSGVRVTVESICDYAAER